MYQVHWDIADMIIEDGGVERAPLMIWDVALDNTGIAYLTTYMQVWSRVKNTWIPVKIGEKCKCALVSGLLQRNYFVPMKRTRDPRVTMN